MNGSLLNASQVLCLNALQCSICLGVYLETSLLRAPAHQREAADKPTVLRASHTLREQHSAHCHSSSQSLKRLITLFAGFDHCCFEWNMASSDLGREEKVLRGMQL